MTEIIRDIRLAPGEPLNALLGKAARKAGIRRNDIKIWRILRRSLDARKKNDIHYMCSVEISTDPEAFGPDWIAGAGAGGSAVPRRFTVHPSAPTDIASVQNCSSVFSQDGIDAQYLRFDSTSWDGRSNSRSSGFSLRCAKGRPSRPVIAGFGPAGMFAGLTLARAGLRPIILERGQRVENRSETVALFRKTGILDPESNAQFGEGGAGTFSDGKLNTGTHDSRIGSVLLEFYRHGAPESVLYDAKPHIGTDVLVNVVRNIREEILSLGGEILFDHRLEGLVLDDSGGDSPHLSGVRVTSRRKAEKASSGVSVSDNKDPNTAPVPNVFCSEEDFILPCENLILAVGHSARDTFEVLNTQGIPMTRKAFSMGARIEHLQSDIDTAQYGALSKDLPAADYSLSVHLPDGSSAYTFCMCPGGYIFAAASEEGGICTNGMSYSGRSGVNANSALLVTLQPEDFPGDGVLAGMHWQREIERKAFSCSTALYASRSDSENAVPVSSTGAYRAPCQRVGDFLAERPSTGPGKVLPSYLPGVVWGDLRQILPEKITSVMAAALPELDKKLRGFASPDAILTGPETRSSSPVRILRNEDCMSSVSGLFPCGEGAGYAGGITSAAVDGIRCAEALIRVRV